MRLDRLQTLDVVEITQRIKKGNVFWSFRGFAFPVDEVVREARVEVIALFYFRDILWTELQAKGLNVGLQMSYFPTADKRIDVGCL